MDRSLSPKAMSPSGLIIDQVHVDESGIVVVAHSRATWSTCPSCGVRSRHVHSRYARRLSDLPAHGRPVRITLDARRFRCAQSDCQRKIFAERFVKDVVEAYARRTARLEGIVHHLGLALGGRPGQELARRLLMPVSKDTLLRVVRARAPETEALPRVIGIDDWAWKRGHRYGTLVCDLERRRIVDILPDRDAATVEAWLADRSEIEIVSRDRGGGYGQAVAKALPEAIQVADRWHLMENASQAFREVVSRMLWKFPGGVLRACEGSGSQAARSRGIGSRG